MGLFVKFYDEMSDDNFPSGYWFRGFNKKDCINKVDGTAQNGSSRGNKDN